ncbi:MAG TPA: 3-dehydroquinate synthase [Candidatus Eisenbacteria bacterium]|nr:3-dehydroquinate synthase [Candidatus Eisenbacteria bacterium]
MIRVRVLRRPVTYRIEVGAGLLDRAGRLLRAVDGASGRGRGGSALLVTDRTVGALYGGRVERSLERAGFRVRRITLPSGERAKSFRSYRRICDAWARARVDRDALVVALGGGVVSDVAGFAAASYARGLRWAALPTTVVAQADAAIGGKTGIDLETGKNLVGAIHHPEIVLADTGTLRTLPPRELRAGLAEVLKIGVIARPRMIPALERLARGTRRPNAGRGRRALVPLLREAARAKARLVSLDEGDRGARRALNFGHTVGHALETASGYRRYLHGEAVSIGMVAALRLSVLEAGLHPVDAADVEALLARLGLPTRLDREPGTAFWRALSRDKKRGRSALRMVLCPAIGKSKVFELSSLTTLRRVVSSLVR